MKERIELGDTVQSSIFKMSDGNPGAINVMAIMIRDGAKIDPQGAFGGFGIILLMDTFGIYGSRIWVLFKDVCGQSLVNTIAVLRACQLGIISPDKLNTAIDKIGEGIDVAAVLLLVKEQLKDFGNIES